MTSRLVFLIDVDNTLLDNDRAKADLGRTATAALGDQGVARLWQHYEAVRRDLDVVSYPEVMRRLASEAPGDADWQAQVAEVAALIDDWPFERYVFPGAKAAIQRLARFGTVAILSDGDDYSQPRKVTRAGLEAAVGGRRHVLIFAHKETQMAEITSRLPGDAYVLIDDKEAVLARAKLGWPLRLTTVWVRQGRYAADPAWYQLPDPDLAVDHIASVPDALADQFGW